MTSPKFKILSIDGGGIRGIFPAMILANFEAELKKEFLSVKTFKNIISEK